MDKKVFIDVLTNKCGINLDKSVLLGFSGGPDSLCLLYLLLECGARVNVAHLDHGLRETSASEAAHALALCHALGVRCTTKKLDVAGFATANHISVEESARILRYQFLFAEAARNHDQAVLVGHNADDQVETVLMHLIRGSGLSGLAGMRNFLLPNPWSELIPLLRPLLDYNREEINLYLRERKLEPVMDASNTDSKYYRNRIRLELLPILETYNPLIRQRLINMATVITTEDDFILQETKEAWENTVIEQGEKFLVLDRNRLTAIHPAIQRRLWRKAINWMDNTLRDIDYQVINKAADFCSRPTRTNRIDLSAGIELFAYKKDRVVLAYASDPLHQMWPQLTRKTAMALPVPGELWINDYWKIVSSLKTKYEPNLDRMVAQVDAQKIREPLVIGTVIPGEKFSPLGYRGENKKVGDFWTGEGLPARARSNWPLIRAGNEIIWIPGFRIADSVKVEETTTRIIHLELKKATGR